MPGTAQPGNTHPHLISPMGLISPIDPMDSSALSGSALGFGARRTLGGKAGSGQVTSLSSRTGSPSSMARLTAASAPSTGQPSVSSPGSPAASVAVLSTGSAPSTSATRAASAFAPDRLPGVAAEERDRVPGRLVHADHGRVGALVGQQWRDQPDGRAGGQEADQRVALGPGLGSASAAGPG